MKQIGTQAGLNAYDDDHDESPYFRVYLGHLETMVSGVVPANQRSTISRGGTSGFLFFWILLTNMGLPQLGSPDAYRPTKHQRRQSKRIAVQPGDFVGDGIAGMWSFFAGNQHFGTTLSDGGSYSEWKAPVVLDSCPRTRGAGQPEVDCQRDF